MSERWSAQEGHEVRFEWGLTGLLTLATAVRVIVIIDVLRFTTAVEAAVSRGAAVYPHSGSRGSAAEFARSRGAFLADGSDPTGYSLSPATLLGLNPGDAVVLPSPNGSTCAVAAASTGADAVIAGCFRNAHATALWVRRHPGPCAVIACGERWPDGSLRPAIEDGLAAGAVIHELSGLRSPEAAVAAEAWAASKGQMLRLLRGAASGRELQLRGQIADVEFAAQLNVSTVVPMLTEGAFRAG